MPNTLTENYRKTKLNGRKVGRREELKQMFNLRIPPPTGPTIKRNII